MNKTLLKIKEKYLSFHKSSLAWIVYCNLFVVFIFLTILLNLIFINNHSYSLSKIFNVLFNWNTSLTTEDHIIKVGLWNISATFIAAIGLSLAAIVSQSLTKNNLADGSTLGLVQAAIFGIIFIISLGLTSLILKYTFALIGAAICASILLALIFVSKLKTSNKKIILIGLALGILFKVFTFLFKHNDENASYVSYAYVLGGAESISSNPLAVPEIYFNKTIIISAIGIFIALILAILNLKGMSVLELGDEYAKSLGQNSLLTRIINIMILIIAIPSAVIIIGNVAFLGLFSVHIARWILKSRDYKKVLPITIIVAILISQFAYQLTEHIPQINSGLWMTFIGAPYLIYIGMKGLK